MKFITSTFILLALLVLAQGAKMVSDSHRNYQMPAPATVLMKPFIKSVLKPEPVNDRVLIGILTQPRNETHDYTMAAYVKFIEQSGARAVRVNWRLPDDELVSLISKINGVLFPGGSTSLSHEDGSLSDYSMKGKVILDKAKEMNDKGIHFPVWAVCLGFEEIAQIEAPYNDTIQSGFESYNYANNVTFVTDVSKSKMLSQMPAYLVNAIQKENITFNSHHKGIKPETFTKYKGLKEYQVLGVAYDNNGVEYTSIYEHKKYPIYAHQYHPEKNAFIFSPNLVVPHTLNAILLGQFYSNFFVQEAKKNMNKFDSYEEEFAHMIENAKPELTTTESMDIYAFLV